MRIALRERRTRYAELSPNVRQLLEHWHVTEERWDAREYSTILASRHLARAKIEETWPGAPEAVVLDAADVEVASPSYLHEWLIAHPDATLENANEDVQASWDIAIEHVGRGRS